MEMKKEFVFVLMFVLMLSLVAGAGYNVVVPTTTTPPPSSSSGGGGGTTTITTTTNATDNETVPADGDEGSVDEDEGIGDAVSDGIDNVKDFIKNIGLKEIFILISGLAVIGASVWYFLKDRRKGYVEVKVKGSKKK
ncbi:MAG: hypothetical protein KKF50_04680 [Nanoarchaeota archaeon]|nr:hypothetical protein [Nanoarchaeota archaeon]